MLCLSGADRLLKGHHLFLSLFLWSLGLQSQRCVLIVLNRMTSCTLLSATKVFKSVRPQLHQSCTDFASLVATCNDLAQMSSESHLKSHWYATLKLWSFKWSRTILKSDSVWDRRLRAHNVLHILPSYTFFCMDINFFFFKLDAHFCIVVTCVTTTYDNVHNMYCSTFLFFNRHQCSKANHLVTRSVYETVEGRQAFIQKEWAVRSKQGTVEPQSWSKY